MRLDSGATVAVNAGFDYENAVRQGARSLSEMQEDEEDMLDLAFGLTHTSRLGCQIIITEELDGLTVTLPQATRNMMVK